MQLISQFSKLISFLLYMIDIFSKYTCVIPLKYKKGATILDDSKRKSNKIWEDKGSEFLMKSWPGKNRIEIYSRHDEGKFFVEKR